MGTDGLISDSVPVETLLNAKNLENVFRAMFTDAIIKTTTVKTGKSSGNIYINKKHLGKQVTVIIWG